MFSPCYFHVIISIGILENNSLSLSTRVHEVELASFTPLVFSSKCLVATNEKIIMHA